MDCANRGDCGQPAEKSNKKNAKENPEKQTESSPKIARSKPHRYHKNPKRRQAKTEAKEKKYEASSDRISPEHRTLESERTRRHSARRERSVRRSSASLEKNPENLSKVKYTGSSLIEEKSPEISPELTQTSIGFGNAGPKANIATNAAATTSKENTLKILMCLCLSIVIGCCVGSSIGFGVVSLLTKETTTESLTSEGTILTRTNGTTTSERVPGSSTRLTSGRTTNADNETSANRTNFGKVIILLLVRLTYTYSIYVGISAFKNHGVKPNLHTFN